MRLVASCRGSPWRQSGGRAHALWYFADRRSRGPSRGPPTSPLLPLIPAVLLGRFHAGPPESQVTVPLVGHRSSIVLADVLLADLLAGPLAGQTRSPFVDARGFRPSTTPVGDLVSVAAADPYGFELPRPVLLTAPLTTWAWWSCTEISAGRSGRWQVSRSRLPPLHHSARTRRATRTSAGSSRSGTCCSRCWRVGRAEAGPLGTSDPVPDGASAPAVLSALARAMSSRRPHPSNVPGDFYVEDGCCTTLRHPERGRARLVLGR